jgi:hypothetical protein
MVLWICFCDGRHIIGGVLDGQTRTIPGISTPDTRFITVSIVVTRAPDHAQAPSERPLRPQTHERVGRFTAFRAVAHGFFGRVV